MVASSRSPVQLAWYGLHVSTACSLAVLLALLWLSCSQFTVVLGDGGVFIEDGVDLAIKPTFHMLLGAAHGRHGENDQLLSTDAEKRPWMDAIAFDFERQVAAATSVASASSGGAGAKLRQSVRIYIHRVPKCAGEEVLDLFMPGDPTATDSGGDASTGDSRGFGWSLALQLHAKHAAAVHRAILSSDAVVTRPEDATVFYIPAFLGFLVERWIDTADTNYLNCLSAVWHELPEELFLRNAGYDHFIVAGTCHPYSICSSMECDITTFHPFAGNVGVLVGGVRELGHLDRAFEPVAVYPLLRTVVVPFPVTLDCALLNDAVASTRPVAVAFIGSENSRIRSIFRRLVEDPRRPYVNDSRILVRVFPDTEEAEDVRRAALGGGEGLLGAGHWRRQVPTAGVSAPAGSLGVSAAGGLGGVGELYAASEFCLVLPGHVYDLGRRAYDIMRHGCIPVVVAAAPMHVSLPFAWQVPWRDFAVFASVGSVADAAVVMDALVTAAAGGARDRISARRAALLRHVPSLFLPPHVRCQPGTPSAMDGILLELAVRQLSWAALRAVRPPEWPRQGVVAI